MENTQLYFRNHAQDVLANLASVKPPACSNLPLQLTDCLS